MMIPESAIAHLSPATLLAIIEDLGPSEEHDDLIKELTELGVRLIGDEFYERLVEPELLGN